MEGRGHLDKEPNVGWVEGLGTFQKRGLRGTETLRKKKRLGHNRMVVLVHGYRRE